MATSKAGLYTAPEKTEGSHTAPERYECSHTAPERSEGSHTAPERYECSHTAPEKSEGSHTAPERTKGSHTAPERTKGSIGLATVSGKLGDMNISSDDAATKTVLLGRKVQSRSQVNVKAGDDKKPPWITGCTVMTNGDVVLCDGSNHKIKLLNSSGVLTGNMKLSLWPQGVSVLDPSSVIVTLPHKKQLQVVQVYPQLKPGRVIQLDKKCWGVAVGKGELYVTCCNIFDGEVRVLGLDGKVKRRLGVNQDGSFMFTMPEYITLNSSGEKIFVSDNVTDIVTCMSVDGRRVIYTYEDDSMRNPGALLCDSEDNILVCGMWSNDVQVLTADGKRHCTLLTASDGLKAPCSIAYRDSDNTLLVGCDDNDHLLSFQLTK